ncbi:MULTISPECIES: hypothetical protein [unclassified Chelatococcus]|uniref:hypothetical protein n=1 Tax=unclassified Chelatococcus TaxID=2638111 RepID=UPI001BCB929E|nr:MULTISPECIES: hypothetical protein [unclassified Chelatococcus]MBS7701483.1 hypothetical protein [Chelatococcus sp. YT9]MBX3559213.1 hypothetical protein [Chelatococcus sp.]
MSETTKKAPAARKPRIAVPIPRSQDASDTLSKPASESQTEMTFRMDTRFAVRFKIEAAKRRMKMREMFEAATNLYLETHPSDEKWD